MDSMWDKSRKRNTWVTQWLFKMLVGTKFSSCVWIANSFIEMLLKGKFWVSVKKKMVEIISDVDHVSRWRKHWDTHHVFVILQFSSVALSCLTLCDPMNHSTPGLPVHFHSQSPPKPMSIVSVIPSNRLMLCRPFLLLPSIPRSIRVSSNESPLRIRWPKYWSFKLQYQSFQWIFRTDFL